MITLVVKGVDPLDGWVYLGQKGANSGHHCTRMDCRAGRALFETVTGQRLFPRRMPSFFWMIVALFGRINHFVGEVLPGLVLNSRTSETIRSVMDPWR